MTGKTEKIIIGKDGIARGIHGPLVALVTAKLGAVAIMRASHVEPGSGLSQQALAAMYGNGATIVIPLLPDPASAVKPLPNSLVIYQLKREYATKWFADMTPVQANLVLGPYDDRDTALREEVEWLKAHNVPVCGPCRDAAKV